MSDAPAISQPAAGIETTIYVYPTKSVPSRANPGQTVDVPDLSKPARSSTTRLYHDCGGEWTSAGEVEHVDGMAEMRHRCSGCRAYGRHLKRFPVERTLS